MPTQRDLFGNVVTETNPDAPIKVIILLSPMERKAATLFLDNCNLKEFKPIAEKFLYICKTHRIRYRAKDGELKPVPTIDAMLGSKSQKPKAQWVDFMALFLNKKNFHLLTDTFSPRMLELWNAVLRNVFVSEQTANAIVGDECFGIRKTLFNFSYKDLKEPYNTYFQTTIDSMEGTDTYFITMQSLRWIQTFRAITPGFNDNQNQEAFREDLPQDDTLLTYSAEGLMLSSIPAMQALQKSSGWPRRVENISATQAKRIHKVFPFPTLFPSETDELLREWSLYMGAKVAAFGLKGILDREAPLLQFKIVANACTDNAYRTLPILLPHLKGLKAKGSEWNQHNGQHVTNSIWRHLKHDALNGWIPVGRLLHDVQTSSIAHDEEVVNGDELTNFLLHTPYDLKRMYITNTFTGKHVSCDHFVSDIAEPYVEATLFMLALLGLVDIAYHIPKAGAPSPYSGFRYVRVNNLGRFLMGLSDKYTPTDAGKEKSYELDKEHLIIHSSADNPFNVFLCDMAVQLTPTLFRMDFTTLFKKCQSATDVANTINTFCQYITSDWPPIWKDFFNEAIERSKMFAQPVEDYMAFRLPDCDKKLQRLILTQPELRKFVIKAENYTLVLKANDYTAFGKALRKFGYVFT